MKIFISYHLRDQKFREKTENILKHYKIDYYVVPKDINFNGRAHDYIRSCIFNEMKSCNVLLCLVGRETYSRPHIDREIHEALKGEAGERLGIIGVLLSSRQDSFDSVDLNTFPKKLWDNREYVVWTTWENLNSNLLSLLDKAIENANNKNFVTNHSNSCMELRKKKYYKK